MRARTDRKSFFCCVEGTNKLIRRILPEPRNTMRTLAKDTHGSRPYSLDFREDMILHLRTDPKYAHGFLSACLEEGHGAFQEGLRMVIDAFGGMTKVARKTALNREALYRALSRRGNPRLENVEKVLGVLGMGLSVVDRPAQARKRKVAGARRG